MNLYVCASPRLEKSTSLVILNDLRRFIDDREEDRLILPLRVPEAVEEREKILERMNSAENVIVAFPLYVDSWPSHLIQWMELWSRFRGAEKKRRPPGFS